MGANGQSGFPLPFCRHIASVFHVVLIILSMLSACWGGFGHISGPKRFFPVKNIQTTTCQMSLHKLRVAGVKSLISKRRWYPSHSECSVAEASVGKGGTLKMLEAFIKELDAVGWDPEPCRWLGWVWVPKPGRWLKDSKCSLIRWRGLLVSKTVEVVETKWGSKPSYRQLV